MLEVSAADARRIALWRQGLLGPVPKPGSLAAQQARVRAMLNFMTSDEATEAKRRQGMDPA